MVPLDLMLVYMLIQCTYAVFYITHHTHTHTHTLDKTIQDNT